jgi:L-histidine N-alpha-methyltransferase
MTDESELLTIDQQLMLTDVLAGLGGAPKALPSKYFYDETGSRIFDEITQLPEYYPTRTETKIIQSHAREIASTLGEGALLIEFGSGSSSKTRMLLDEMQDMAGYVPVDVSGDYLQQVADGLQTHYPHIPVHPVVADFTQPFSLPTANTREQRKIVYFPGSTLGNFTPHAATQVLRHMAKMSGPQGGVLIGIDLLKSTQILIAAYNDAQNVTARFNLNLLSRLNRELGANFDIEQFRHQALFNLDNDRIEMRLFARSAQSVQIADATFHFDKDESILTEYSHKYTLQSFADLATQAQLQISKVWTDPEQQFSVQYLTPLV